MPVSLGPGIQVMTQYKQTMAFIKPLYRDLAKRRVPGDMLAGWVPVATQTACVVPCMLRFTGGIVAQHLRKQMCFADQAVDDRGRHSQPQLLVRL